MFLSSRAKKFNPDRKRRKGKEERKNNVGISVLMCQEKKKKDTNNGIQFSVSILSCAGIVSVAKQKRLQLIRIKKHVKSPYS